MFSCGVTTAVSVRPGKGVHHPVASVIDTVVNLAKRRGFVYPRRRDLRRHEIGVGLRAVGRGAQREHQTAVVASVVTGRDDVVGLDSSIILPRQVWVASGHVEVFHDPLVESLITHKRYRPTTHRGVRGQAWAATAERAGRHPLTRRPAIPASGPSRASST